MGQCMSHKAAGAFVASAATANSRPSKKKHSTLRSPEDDNNSLVNTTMKKTHAPLKGVASSFGFKRPVTAPSALTVSNSNAARRLANPEGTDTNGNDRNNEDTRPLIVHPHSNGRLTPKLQPPKKEAIAPQRISRFGFRQPQVNRTNKVADLNAEVPSDFGVAKNTNVIRRPSPTNTVPLQFKYKPSNVVAPTATTILASVDNNRNRTNAPKNYLRSTNQFGKFTLQTTQLPAPQTIFVLESTKTAKTLANNNTKMANVPFRRPSPNDSSKDGSLTEDSGVGSNLGNECDRSASSPSSTGRKQRNLEIVMLNGNMFDVRDTDDSSKMLLPTLPSNFCENLDGNSVFQKRGTVKERTVEYERQMEKNSDSKISTTSSESFSDTSCQSQSLLHKSKQSSYKSFLKPKPLPVKTFLKTNVVDNKGYSSSASSDEHEWILGGEAMAEEVSFSISSSDESRDRDQEVNDLQKNYDTTLLRDNRNNVFLNKILPTLPIKSDLKSVTLTIAKSTFETVANDSDTLLLDETSPIDSLLSSSESEECLKSKTTSKQSLGFKDATEKPSPSTPGTPTNASNSLSLSEGKEDFLIDDEIADQPALVFGDKSHNSETTLVDSTPRSRRKRLRNFEGSPLILKDRKALQNSNVSLDTLSPCESIASDDMMMDYDYSQSSGLDDLDRLDRKNDKTVNSTRDDAISNVSSIEVDIKNNEQLRVWSSLLNHPKERTIKSNVRTKFFDSRTSTPTSVCESASSLDGSKSNGRLKSSMVGGASLRRFTQTSPPSCESDDAVVKLDRSAHTAIKTDVNGIKTVLFELRRVLNGQADEDILLMSETHNPFGNKINGDFSGFCSDSNGYDDDLDYGRSELEDLKRQLIFLQGQLEDKDRAVQSLQEQMTKMCLDNHLSNSAPASTVGVDREKCNAATQTERVRPLSIGPLSPTDIQAQTVPGSFVSAIEQAEKLRSTRSETTTQKKVLTRERHKFRDL